MLPPPLLGTNLQLVSLALLWHSQAQDFTMFRYGIMSIVAFLHHGIASHCLTLLHCTVALFHYGTVCDYCVVFHRDVIPLLNCSTDFIEPRCSTVALLNCGTVHPSVLYFWHCIALCCSIPPGTASPLCCI